VYSFGNQVTLNLFAMVKHFGVKIK